MKRYKLVFLTLFLPFVLDRITKYLALTFDFRDIVLTPFLTFNLEFNRGVSWSLFHSEEPVTFCVLSTIILIIIVTLAWYSYNRFKLGQSIYAESLIISGAISNFVDRLLYGGVADFIVLHFRQIAWPTFNIADTSIFIGVLILITMSLENE
ncbi:signal peptidase II [candidate division TM6 bacterium RIFCSPHIGHO2_12_FULL_32_22]|nr:MAG: signal peptidase II [candidate division TM6 bacterium RIFCSPHIGHO2_12_FULL_32_22]